MSRLAGRVETLFIPLVALLVSALVLATFVALNGADPLAVFQTLYRGGFGTWFSFQNTLQRAAPLMLTALCTALPARLGLIVIGAEGALVIGGLAATVAALSLAGASPGTVAIAMALAGALAGGVWIGLVGGLRHYRGINETIASLLFNYLAIALLLHAVTGPLRDPESLNKPATPAIGDANLIGTIPGMDVHWGLVYGLVACGLAYVLFLRTPFGFATRIVGGNVRAARIAGLPVGRLILTASFLGGASAGLAGMLEVAAVHGRANDSLIAGYGYAGILVAFLARQHPLAILPMALLLGGIGASGGLLQRAHHLPDATVLVLQGIVFLSLLSCETLYGRGLPFMRPRGG